MGSVKVDIHKAERQFELITLSDFDCVKGLIKSRWIVDTYRGIEEDRHYNRAGDIRPMNPELIALFMTLDNLIDRCELNIKQRFIVDSLMDSWTEQEIADKFQQDVNGITKTLNTIVKRIVNLNELDWKYNHVYMNLLKAPFQYKKCATCGEHKPTTADFFHIDALAKDGFKNKCRSCVKNRVR